MCVPVRVCVRVLVRVIPAAALLCMRACLHPCLNFICCITTECGANAMSYTILWGQTKVFKACLLFLRSSTFCLA